MHAKNQNPTKNQEPHYQNTIKNQKNPDLSQQSTGKHDSQGWYIDINIDALV